jgi:diguanylate cyclase (GGDEF)-like protein
LDEALLQAASGNLKDPQRFRTELERLYQHPELEIQDEIEFKDGRIFERHSAALPTQNQQHMGRMFFFRDITERKRDERKMALLARTDALTGLANRATFLDRLGLALAASRRGDTPFAVHFLDLDNFKDVNDSLGHHTGDVLLKTMSQRMTAAVRENDLVARFGGDEFSILQSDVTDPSTAGTLAAKIRALLAEPYAIDGSVLRVTATIGIALYAPDVKNAAEILAQADRALYRAKEEGRDRYRFHSQELDAVVHERVSIAEELRAGIGRDELELYYQPQVTVATGEIVGVEALVRWNHPGLGQLTPGAFLPAAERTGVIVPLGAWVLDKACQQFRQWRDQGVAPPVISVNLSGSQLKLGRDFYHEVQKTLLKWGLAPRDLEFDVPEEVLSDAFGANPDVLQKLHDLGVRIAIDDFGAEYTSIGRLKAYGVKRLKIAPQLIKSMTFDAADAGAVRLMLHLASQLGIEIIAKSVETEEQQAFLLSTAEGANAQGFFYSKPLPAAQATEFLRQKQIESPVSAH